MVQKHNIIIKLPCPAEQLLPHRPPMLLIDKLLQREIDRAEASAKLQQNTIFLSKDRCVLPEYFIEIVAQTMAAANGYDALIDNLPVSDGYLVGIETFSMHDAPLAGDEFRIVTIKDMEFGQMQVIDGVVSTDKTRIASVRLKLWKEKN